MKKDLDRNFEPVISKKLCKQCNLCIKFCPRGVLKTDNKGFPIAKHPEKCNGCFVCFLRCPDFALEVNQNDK